MKNKKSILRLISMVLCLSFVFSLATSVIYASDAEADTFKEEVKGEITLYIVRHGKTMLNTTDRVQGWSDAVLTLAGEEVVRNAGIGLSDIEFSAVYSSDSGRSIQTAVMILDENELTDVDLKTDKRLREFNFGTYEGELNDIMWEEMAEYNGMTIDELMGSGLFSYELFANSISALDKERVAEYDVVNWPAENYDEIITRLLEGITEIAENESLNGDGNVLVVSHGLSIISLLDELFPEAELPRSGLKNASVNIIKYKDGEFTLVAVNDMSYVEKGALVLEELEKASLEADVTITE